VDCPVLDTGRDSSGQWTVDSGQWTVDSGQWTVDRGTIQYGTTGHWTGHPVLDRRSPGQWTVDGTEWTEVLSLL
jgi:hypothetical protein